MITISFKGKPGDRYNKVTAIKALRSLTRCGLKDAKEAIELAEDSAGAADVDMNVDYDRPVYERDKAIADLMAEGFVVSSPLSNLIHSLDTALEIAVKERKHAVARKILEVLEELGI